jgi:predicted RND superfamily exporter protein
LPYLNVFTRRRGAIGALVAASVITAIGLVTSFDLKIGDLDVGAPELRPDSRYNRDNAYITTNYGLSSDQFAIIVKTPPEGVASYETIVELDRLSWALNQIPVVQTVKGLADAVRVVTSATCEGSPKWLTISRNQDVTNMSVQQAWHNNRDLFNGDCSVTSVIAYLSDHKADTLEHVAEIADEFAQTHSREDRQFLLAAGNAGIEAATNIVVREANYLMLMYVYLAVILFCFITFRSWRAVLVAIIPLMSTSILCEALMVILGIGVKVATLPVIALGVGIGVDYALYLLSVQLMYLRMGMSLTEAYAATIQFTGKVVALIGITLASGVFIWAWSPIKFQADMGILLTFMFFWNMLGSLILIPSLSHFLLNNKKTAVTTEEQAAIGA